MGPALPLAESTAGLPSPSPVPLATGRGAGKESESMLGSHHTRFTGTRCKAAAVAAPERPMASRGEGEGGDRRGGSDEGRAAAARPGKETRVVEAVVLIPLQHRFFTCEKRSKTIKHIKETFDKVRAPLAWRHGGWEEPATPGEAVDFTAGLDLGQRTESTEVFNNINT